MKLFLKIMLTLGGGVLITTSVTTVISCGTSEMSLLKVNLDDQIPNKDLGTIRIEPGKTELTATQLVKAINDANNGLDLREGDIKTPDFNKKISDKGNYLLRVFASDNSKAFKDYVIVEFNYGDLDISSIEESVDITGNGKYRDDVINPTSVLDAINDANNLQWTSKDVTVKLNDNKTKAILIVTHKHKNYLDDASIMINFIDSRPTLNIEITEITFKGNEVDKDKIITPITVLNQVNIDNDLHLTTDDVTVNLDNDKTGADLIISDKYKNVGKTIGITINFFDSRLTLNIERTEIAFKGKEVDKDKIITPITVLNQVNIDNDLHLTTDDVIVNLDDDKTGADLIISDKYKNVGKTISITIKFSGTTIRLIEVLPGDTKLGPLKIDDDKSEITDGQIINAINNKIPGLRLTLDDVKVQISSVPYSGDTQNVWVIANETSKKFTGQVLISFTYILINIKDFFTNITSLRIKEDLRDLGEKDFKNKLIKKLSENIPSLDINELVFSNIHMYVEGDDKWNNVLSTWQMNYTVKQYSRKYYEQVGSVPNHVTFLESPKLRYSVNYVLDQLNGDLAITEPDNNNRNKEKILDAFITANSKLNLDKSYLDVKWQDNRYGDYTLSIIPKIGPDNKYRYFGWIKLNFGVVDSRSYLNPKVDKFRYSYGPLDFIQSALKGFNKANGLNLKLHSDAEIYGAYGPNNSKLVIVFNYKKYQDPPMYISRI